MQTNDQQTNVFPCYLIVAINYVYSIICVTTSSNVQTALPADHVVLVQTMIGYILHNKMNDPHKYMWLIAVLNATTLIISLSQ